MIKLFRIIAALFLILSFHCSYSQETEVTNTPKINKNTVHASIGYLAVMGAVNLNYERLILGFEKNSLEGVWGKVSYGGWGVWSVSGPYQSLSLGILTGEENNHFELNLGGARMVNSRTNPDPSIHMSGSNKVNFNVVGSLGYRYQKPTGKFVFRSGVGHPESIYVGFGVAF